MTNSAEDQGSEEYEEEEVTEQGESEVESEDEQAAMEDQDPGATTQDLSIAHPAAEQVEKKITSPQDIPLNIVVEVGRLQMSVKTLMELKPGNLLDLHVHPETGVELVVNGTRVGKGELLKIGDTIGVRILELG